MNKVYLNLQKDSLSNLGLLDYFITDEDKIFTLNNATSNGSQAFAITLKPTGGSEMPTMEQLYTLGVIQS